jgi:chemotaxis-related protein WspB
MTFLIFSIDDRRFALSTDDVVTVVPAGPLQRLDGAPPWVAGVLPALEDLVPVVDICQLQAGRPARRAYSTRVVLVRYPRAAADVRTLGILAEGVTDVADVAPGGEPGVRLPDTPWLGPLADVGSGLAQRVTIADLVPASARERLFP